MADIHHIDESDESDLSEIINNDSMYKVGDMIEIDFNNQMGERMYKITVKNGRKTLEIVRSGGSSNKYYVTNMNELTELLLYKGKEGDNILRKGDVIYLNDTKYTIGLDDYGLEIAEDEDGNKINSEGNMYRGGSRRRKSSNRKTHRRKSMHKRRSNKRKSMRKSMHKRKSSKRKSRKHRK